MRADSASMVVPSPSRARSASAVSIADRFERWAFSANRMSCWIARRLSALPYVYAPMHRNDYLFTARSEPLGVFSAQYRLGSVMDRKDEVDRWLTERYALFQEKGPHLYRYQTHHREWPIHACEVPDPIHAPKRWPRLFAGHPARAHYSTGVAVLTWAAERC